MPYLLLLAFIGTRTTQAVATKMNSRSYSSLGGIGSFLYVLVTGVFSLFFYWAFGGFSLSFNTRVIIYSAIYAAIVILSLIPTVFMYNYGSITAINFISNTVSLIFSAIVGVAVFEEIFGIDKMLRIIIMLAAATASFIGAKKVASQKADGSRRRMHPLAIILPSIVAVVGVLSSVMVKAYGEDAAVTDTNSFFFMTNVFCILYALPVILILAKKKAVAPRALVGMVIDKRTAVAFISTAIGSLQQLITAAMLAVMDVAVYTPVIAALGFIALAIATPIVRERLDRYTVIATVLAVLSILIPTLISL